MDTGTYLKRIEYTEPVKPDAQTLHGLQAAHMLHVPFENLDIRLKRPIRLDEQSLWNKIVTNKRGGFCYELNGLFAWLLKQIGFNVTYLNARVYDREGNLGIEFDHLTLLVQIPGRNERWLADVGFGDSFIIPLSFEGAGEQTQGLRSYLLEEIHNGFVVWQRNNDDTLEQQYFFDLKPHEFPEEYETACIYHQASPKSTFTQWSVITRATENGRVSLEDGRLILTTNGQKEYHEIKSKDEYRLLLKEHFDVEL